MPESATGQITTARTPPAVRPLWFVILALLLGAGALWLSSRLGWEDAPAGGGVPSAVEQAGTAPGQERALVPLALLALAGIAGVLATRGWPRRVLCGVLGIAGIGGAGVGISGMVDEALVRPAHTVAVLGGLLLLAAGLEGLRAARRMPSMGARYSRQKDKPAAADPDTDLWDALSAGKDPTTGK